MTTYQIERIADLLLVPPSRREDCVREILLGLELLEFAAGDEGHPIIEGSMTWTDNGVNRINLDMGDDSLTLEVTDS